MFIHLNALQDIFLTTNFHNIFLTFWLKTREKTIYLQIIFADCLES